MLGLLSTGDTESRNQARDQFTCALRCDTTMLVISGDRGINACFAFHCIHRSQQKPRTGPRTSLMSLTVQRCVVSGDRGEWTASRLARPAHSDGHVSAVQEGAPDPTRGSLGVPARLPHTEPPRPQGQCDGVKVGEGKRSLVCSCLGKRIPWLYSLLPLNVLFTNKIVNE